MRDRKDELERDLEEAESHLHSRLAWKRRWTMTWRESARQYENLRQDYDIEKNKIVQRLEQRLRQEEDYHRSLLDFQAQTREAEGRATTA